MGANIKTFYFCDILGMYLPSFYRSIPLTTAPIQNYTYFNKELTMDKIPASVETFKIIHKNKKLSSLDQFYLPLH